MKPGFLRRTISAFLRAAIPERQFMRPSFAEFGEDIAIHNLINMFGSPNHTFLDIGSNHPVASNNTYFFYRIGWRGICVEPNSTFSNAYKKFRPHDKLLVCGVTVGSQKTAPYYMFETHGLNTFSEDAAISFQKKGHKLLRTEERELVDINTLISTKLGLAPAILSIDIEGLDDVVLRNLDFDKWRPKYICAEIRDSVETIDTLRRYGYERMAELYSNQIWMLKEL